MISCLTSQCVTGGVVGVAVDVEPTPPIKITAPPPPAVRSEPIPIPSSQQNTSNVYQPSIAVDRTVERFRATPPNPALNGSDYYLKSFW